MALALSVIPHLLSNKQTTKIRSQPCEMDLIDSFDWSDEEYFFRKD